MFLIRKARKLARKWGGQCIIFIDEIDAVGMRRQALGGGGAGCEPLAAAGSTSSRFYGPWGAHDRQRRPRPRDARLARAHVRARSEAPAPIYPPAIAGLQRARATSS